MLLTNIEFTHVFVLVDFLISDVNFIMNKNPCTFSGLYTLTRSATYKSYVNLHLRVYKLILYTMNYKNKFVISFVFEIHTKFYFSHFFLYLCCKFSLRVKFHNSCRSTKIILYPVWITRRISFN